MLTFDNKSTGISTICSVSKRTRMHSSHIFYFSKIKLPASTVIHRVILKSFITVINRSFIIGNDYRIVHFCNSFNIQGVIVMSVCKQNIIRFQNIYVNVFRLWISRNIWINNNMLPTYFYSDTGMSVECDFHKCIFNFNNLNTYLPPRKTFTIISETKNIRLNANKIDRKNVLKASFFNSGSKSFGFLFL